jgi:hypothetical protein
LKYGEVTLVGAEAVKDFFGWSMANLVSIPKFVRTVQPVSGSDTLYCIYKVTEIAPDALSFLIGGGDGKKNPYKYKKFYFGAIGGGVAVQTLRVRIWTTSLSKKPASSPYLVEMETVFSRIFPFLRRCRRFRVR